jgi:hypothetical protein
MRDSTPFLDACGIRRGVPQVPLRHDLPREGLPVLALIADLGEPDSVTRVGWDNLLRVHGFEAVLRAVARCYHQVDGTGKVSNDQAQAVLDGKLACGHGIIRHAESRRRTRVA